MSYYGNSFIGWHWVDADEIGPCINKEYSKNHVPIIKGKVYDVNEIINYQIQELYASSSITWALKDAPSTYLCRVRLLGPVHKDDSYYYWSKQREVLWIINVDKVLHRFCCSFINKMAQRCCICDERVFSALKAKTDWIDGKASIPDISNATEFLFDVREVYNIVEKTVKDSNRKANRDRVRNALLEIRDSLTNFNSLSAGKRYLACVNSFNKSEYKDVYMWLETEMVNLVIGEAKRLGITEYLPQ